MLIHIVNIVQYRFFRGGFFRYIPYHIRAMVYLITKNFTIIATAFISLLGFIVGKYHGDISLGNFIHTFPIV